jgi:deoxyribodipyrimidine photolyase-related protein
MPKSSAAAQHNAPATAPGSRNLVIVLGDQLDRESLALADFDPHKDAIWMAEVRAESSHVWSHKTRTALFFAAMRRFAEEHRARGWTVFYQDIQSSERLAQHELSAALAAHVKTLEPARLVWVKPGDYRLEQSLRACANQLGLEIDERPDQHFLLDLDAFSSWAKGRKMFRMEHFYRFMREKLGVLMQQGKPVGGQWNFDAENRGSFGKKGPGLLPAPQQFKPDALVRAAIADVEAFFPEHPGETQFFDWPTTPAQAQAALDDFIAHRLLAFGDYQDAMWSDSPWLYHARISAAMNLKLLHPKQVIAAVEKRYAEGGIALSAVEGFIRQVLGWREFVRGLYWHHMPAYLSDNALQAQQPLPAFYWTGQTDMRCMAQVLKQTLQLGYAHHIQRLMVTGNFALMLGVQPQAVHAWYLAVYVDAVEWVEVPNTLGMSQFADGGMLASKPYCSSGRYIERMSNYCSGCRYRPGERLGASACPFTTLYWDFLDRHKDQFAKHPRSAQQWRMLQTVPAEELAQIKQQAQALRQALAQDAAANT